MKFQSEINGQCRQEGTLIRGWVRAGGARREDRAREVGGLLAACPLSSRLSVWSRSEHEAQPLYRVLQGPASSSILTCVDTLQFPEHFSTHHLLGFIQPFLSVLGVLLAHRSDKESKTGRDHRAGTWLKSSAPDPIHILPETKLLLLL